MHKFFRALLASAFLVAPAYAQVNDEAVAGPAAARQLSDYGFFDDLAAFTPNAALIPYTINAPLFTDYADKYRFIYIPDGAPAATYQTENVLDLPIGSALIKTFAYQQNGQMLRIETRLLLHREKGWVAYPYVWNEDQTDAALKVAGANIKVDVPQLNGQIVPTNYHVPNVNQCKGCHVNAEKEFLPIGPKIRNLNVAEATQNQLNRLADLGVINNLPPHAEIPLTSDYTDNSLPIATRARAYLDANCAHCHAPGLPADTSGLYLNWSEDRDIHLGINKPPVAAGRGSGGLTYDIAPGNPEQSIIIYRMNSIDPGVMMPELGRGLIDIEGVALISEYITSLDE